MAMPIGKHDEPFDQVHDVLYFLLPGVFCCETVKKKKFMSHTGDAAEHPMAGIGAVYRKDPDILVPIAAAFDVAPKVIVRDPTANPDQLEC